MEDQNVIYIGVGLLALVLYYVITQWAHQIHKRNRYLEAQIKLLAKIAEKQGVAADELTGIMATAETKHQTLS